MAIIPEKYRNDLILIIVNIIAVLLLLIAMKRNPYSYYIFLRWALMVFFIANIIWSNKGKFWLFIWIIGLITYNPIFPIHSTREVWTIINIITIVVIVFSIYPTIKKFTSEKIEENQLNKP